MSPPVEPARTSSAVSPVRTPGYLDLVKAEPVLVVIMGTVAGHLMIMGMLLPVLPLYASTFGVNEATLGLVITAFGLGRLLVDIPAGLLAEKLGRRVLMCGGPLLLALGSLGCAVADSFGWLVVFRFLQGLGAGAYMTAAGIVCADVSTPETRGRIMALFQSALLIGAGSGPAVGGFLAASFGYTSAFWVAMLIGLGSASYSLWRYRETKRPGRHGEDHSLRAFVPVLRSRLLVVALVASLGVFMTRSSAFMQLLPLLGQQRFGMGPAEMGIGFAMLAGTNLVLLPTSGWLVQRFGTVPLVVLACLGLAGGMALAAWTTIPSLFYVAMIVLGLGSALEGPSLSSYAIAHAPNGQYGPTVGAMRFAGDLGFVLGPVAIGALIDATGVGYGGALWASAVVLVGVAVLFMAVARDYRIETDGNKN
jgi:MFS family permease